MYQFKYQYQYPGIEEPPFITCIVPDEWLTLDLPTMGGAVIYHNDRVRIETQTTLEYQLSELQSPCGSGRIFTLKIKIQPPLSVRSMNGDCRDIHGKTITIRYLTEANKTTIEDTPVELILLNHLFCNFAGSAFTGMSWIDHADIIQWYSQHSELVMEYGIGCDPEEMTKNILARLGDNRIASSYTVIFGETLLTKYEYLSEIVDKLCAGHAYVPAVDQELLLISTLVSDADS